MPLVRARCRACTLPLGDPPPSTVPVTCARCGVAAAVRVAADGQPTELDAAFGPPRLLAWLASARVAMASGTVGVAVGVCASCGSPLAVSSREPVSLPCPHCGEVAPGTAAERLVDQWTEPWARVEGSAIALEYRLAVVEDRTGLNAGCAACGAPTPATDPASTCSQCGAVTWVQREGTRMQLGVRVDGTRGDRPFKVLLPIVQGEAMLRSDARQGTGGGTSLLGATGLGCAAVVALLVALGFGIWAAVHFSHC